MLAATLRQAAKRAAVPCSRRLAPSPRHISVSHPRLDYRPPASRNETDAEQDALSAYEEYGVEDEGADIMEELEEAIEGTDELSNGSGNAEARNALASSADAIPETDYLELVFPSLQSKNKANLPPLMNIPPQEDPLLHFMTSRLMHHGERAKASRHISQMLLHIHAWTRAPPLPIVRQAMFKLSPAVRVIGHKHATKMIYKPVPLSEKQGIWYAMQWLIEATQKSRQGGPTIAERLAREIIMVIKGESETLKKKELFHKTALMNRGNIAIARN
ncbi:hypothetical protein PM082_020748 [Marasmius tenuissimus]|nr:hypothetical protein PM082_020748 [Marasmius tenuissimus]